MSRMQLVNAAGVSISGVRVARSARVNIGDPAMKVALVDNTKPGARTILEAAARQLAPRCETVYLRKNVAPIGIKPEQADMLAAQCGLAICALGD